MKCELIIQISLLYEFLKNILYIKPNGEFYVAISRVTKSNNIFFYQLPKMINKTIQDTYILTSNIVYKEVL